MTNYEDLFRRISQRYGTSNPDAYVEVLTPALLPIESLDKTIFKVPGQTHWRASFTVRIRPEYDFLIVRGRTGKFVPAGYVTAHTPGASWREIAKGRIIDVDRTSGLATGEVYVGARRTELETAVAELSSSDYLEIDHYGASAKVLSGLVEYHFLAYAKSKGFNVTRMPEDMAKHLGIYANYDFLLERGGVNRKVEVKSLWGTDVRYARLIHSKTEGYDTSSCKFATQDIFAVSLFLRTGRMTDFAFARSVPKDVQPYGLPRSSKYPNYVNQNPLCTVGDGTWFADIDVVWNLP